MDEKMTENLASLLLGIMDRLYSILYTIYLILNSKNFSLFFHPPTLTNFVNADIPIRYKSIRTLF
jgi:hypothetical protein